MNSSSKTYFATVMLVVIFSSAIVSWCQICGKTSDGGKVVSFFYMYTPSPFFVTIFNVASSLKLRSNHKSRLVKLVFIFTPRASVKMLKSNLTLKWHRLASCQDCLNRICRRMISPSKAVDKPCDVHYSNHVSPTNGN